MSAQNILFGTYELNNNEIKRIKAIESGFSGLAGALDSVCEDGRCFKIAKTKMEEACFYAKKAIVMDPKNK